MTTIAELRALLAKAGIDEPLAAEQDTRPNWRAYWKISDSTGTIVNGVGRFQAEAITAAVNALPALLDVAEAAQDVLAWGGTQHEAAKLDALEAALSRLEGK
jgi:hypothetical protein